MVGTIAAKKTQNPKEEKEEAKDNNKKQGKPTNPTAGHIEKKDVRASG